jgi:GNAT superfamily N-acetyltransferase
MSGEYEISTERGRLDVDLIYNFLASSYWARDIPLAVVTQSIENSLCFGAYCGGEQAAFARVVTDYATFGYVADVFVVPGHRSLGVAKMVMRSILAHPDLQGLRRLLLATQDAHGLYEQFGFKALAHPDHFMSIHKPDIYKS